MGFLTEQLQNKHDISYNSFNSFRSALSLLLGPEVKQSQVIKRLLKGIFACGLLGVDITLLGIPEWF